jgi:triosephosphate isomerase
LAEKVNISLENGLTPIFCCGESLEQRNAPGYLEFVASQLTDSLFHLSVEDFGKVVIAYEPIWAIGTGVTASSEQAQEMHAFLRAHVATKYGQEVADNIISYMVVAVTRKTLLSCSLVRTSTVV